MNNIRTRFAPSPTGELHLGGLRTALYAFLWARRNNGKFYIRIEDTDRERFVPGSADRMLALFQRLGMTWDEGPDIGGPFAPYVQSERLDRYRVAAKQLLATGQAYRCDCTPERLQELRDAQTAARQSTRYDGRCRERTDVNPNHAHVIRFSAERAIHGEEVFVSDLVHGEMHAPRQSIDDFVLLKSDGFPTYHLAHVVDDHEMQTSHVIRGDEWLPSLPKHVLLFNAFGWTPPEFAHLPLLLNTQRKKLSKRDGDVSVEAFLAWCLPEALVNFVALLGWNPSGDREVYTHGELVALFDLAKVHSAPAVVNFEKLEWLNGEYIRQMDVAALTARIRERSTIGDSDPQFMARAVELERPRLRRLDQFPEWYHRPWHQDAPLAWKGSDLDTAKVRLVSVRELLATTEPWPETPSAIETIVKPWIAEHGYSTGEVLWPLRVALSGQKASPSPFELAWAFGKKETLRRIDLAIAQGT